MAKSLNDLVAFLDDTVAMEKSAQEQIDLSDLSMDQLIKLAEDEGERAAAEMAAADEARLTDAKKDEDEADEDSDEAKAKEEEAKKDEKNMDKEAFLKKLAEIVVSDDGGSEEDMVNAPAAEMVAADDVKVKMNPGLTEGAGNLVQTIMNSSEEAAHETDAGVEVGDGDDMAEPEEDAVTKAAALDNLIEAGFSFDEAADMVKAAAAAVTETEEYSDMDKAAAVGELMGRGMSFEDAVDLVKEATEVPLLGYENKHISKIKGMATRAKQSAQPKIEKAKGAVSGAAGKAKGAVSGAAGKAKEAVSEGARKAGTAIGTAAAQGAHRANEGVKSVIGYGLKHPRSLAALGAVGAAGAVGGAAYGIHKHMKKKAEYTDMDKAAAVGYLMDNGIDFDTAVAAVVEAASAQ